ncbi:MAG: type IV secretion system DNA-binding domain-containing protein [Candidatus Cybelea sp.]
MTANELAEVARQNAARLEPDAGTRGGTAALAAARAIATIAIIVITFAQAIAGGGWTAIVRGVGLLLLVAGSGYIWVAAQMWWLALARHDHRTWATRPSPRIIVYAWVGAALVLLTSLHVPMPWMIGVDGTGMLSLLLALAFWVGVAGLGVLGWRMVTRTRRMGLQVHVPQTRSKSRSVADSAAPQWCLHLGTATGYCRSRNDTRGMYAGDGAALTITDAAKGALICGGMGSGKTTLLRLIARQLMSLGGTALVAISAKPSDAIAMGSMFAGALFLGPGHAPFALFGGLSPEAIAAVFGALAGDPKNPFWKAAVTNLVCAWLQIIMGLAGSTVVIPERREPIYEAERVLTISYSPQSLSDLIYASEPIANAVLAEAARRLPSLSGDAHAQLSAGLAYFSGEYQATLLTARGETLGSVRASVSPYLRALCAPGLLDAFGSGDIDLSSAIDRGDKIIIDIDMAQSPQGFSVVSALILAHLRSIALARTARDAASNNPCVLLADEFGTYGSSEHLALFETARQSRLVCFAAIIALSNLEARLGQAAAYALPSALGSMLVFHTGDSHTRKYVSERIGSVRSLEITAGSSSSPHQSAPFVQNTSYSRSEHYTTAPVIEDAAWTQLGVNSQRGYATAVAILAQGGGVAHDVIMVPA